MLNQAAMRLVNKVPARYQNTAKQFIKFGVTGTLGAVIDFGTVNILTRGFGWDAIYEVFGYKVIAANMISVATAIFVMFFVNKYWTFGDRDGSAVQQGVGYFALNGVTFVLNQILTSFFLFQVPLVAVVFGSMADNASKALAIGIILSVNFAGSKFLIFKKKPVTQTSTSRVA